MRLSAVIFDHRLEPVHEQSVSRNGAVIGFEDFIIYTIVYIFRFGWFEHCLIRRARFEWMLPALISLAGLTTADSPTTSSSLLIIKVLTIRPWYRARRDTERDRKPEEWVSRQTLKGRNARRPGGAGACACQFDVLKRPRQWVNPANRPR